MRRLSLTALTALALTTSMVGCVTFCDDCDNFPAPANRGYSMMPGTYTGPSPTVGGSRTRNEAPRLMDDQAPPATNAPTGTNEDSAIPVTPVNPPANP